MGIDAHCGVDKHDVEKFRKPFHLAGDFQNFRRICSMQNLPLVGERTATHAIAGSICLLTVPSGFLAQPGPLSQRFSATRGSVCQGTKQPAE